ncbi:hypothetical protein NQ314_004083 [Rhamnusium bicolor]|uniref:Glycerol kinase n=1 Tax=Rhamnusium bicolor TaxID=1586634 RepID=A0AAV8ZM25_9CUCU|nr:hypothetical protein NQ314_004083 [Rhamnusium bicolor]
MITECMPHFREKASLCNVWDKTTGEPLYNAIVWNDIRTNTTVDTILAKIPDGNTDYFRHICGLPISPYFSAFKLKWLMYYIPQVKKAVKAKKCLFGTVDTWILWNLTGGVNDGKHITDVTNASRTFLMNIELLNWDPLLLHTFKTPVEILPEIRSSSEIYGQVSGDFPLKGVLISGILGNQQASLLGQNCIKEGQAKSTYRSGCFLLYNTGTSKVQSTHGLITTVAYKFGTAPAVYALEGSVAVAGAAVKWLRDNMGFIKDVQKDTESLAQEVFNTGDVYFVPAFNGLYAPYWRKDARGGVPVIRPQSQDITTLGLAIAAGAAVGVDVWDIHDEERELVPTDTFLPTSTEDERDARYTKWKMAVQRSLGWALPKKTSIMTGM